VRPNGILGLTPKSVRKKLKQPSFAAGVDGEEVRRGAEELGVEFDAHLENVIAAMEERAEELGLVGSGAGSPPVRPAPEAAGSAVRPAAEAEGSPAPPAA
jgi:hypothetical protein